MTDHPYITWELLALGLLSVFNFIVLGLTAWVLTKILGLLSSVQQISNRVSHIEGHLEVSDRRAGVPFKRLDLKAEST